MIRALHVFGVLSRTGGAEKWVLDLLQRQHDRRDGRLQIDFLLSVDDGLLCEQVRRLGSMVHFVPFSRSPLPWSRCNPYLAGVRKILYSQKYDVVHVHQFDLSGEILRIARQEGIPKRIMSVHATEYENPRFYRRWVHRIWGRSWIFRYATDILPCSRDVERSVLAWNRIEHGVTKKSSIVDKDDVFPNKVRVLYTGIDTELFRQAAVHRDLAAERLRIELGIPENAKVVGHIGRFVRQKNHAFLVDLLADMMRRDTRLYAVLLGQGELLKTIRQRVKDKGLEQRIILPGSREDVPDFLVSLFDVFILPSLYEGLPIAACEALAGGLSLVLSDRVSDELSEWFPDRVTRIPLEADFSCWREVIQNRLPERRDPLSALDDWKKTPLTIDASLDHLIEIYEGS